MKKIAILLLSGVLLLTGCSSTPKITKSDICVKKQGESKEICYGMSRSDAEEIAGKGKDIGGKPGRFEYDHDLEIKYRDDKVVSLAIDEDSKDYYQFSSGLKIGDLKGVLEKRYGTSMEGKSESSIISYIYDSKRDRMMSKEDLNNVTDAEEHPDQYIYLSAFDDADGYLSSILIGDLASILIR